MGAVAWLQAARAHLAQSLSEARSRLLQDAREAVSGEDRAGVEPALAQLLQAFTDHANQHAS